MAISILGLSLTVILSSQAGLFSSAARAGNLTYAVPLARCRMAATELELQKFGYSLIDQSDSGSCCAENDPPGFGCEWKVETIELPDASLAGLDVGFGEGAEEGMSGDLSGPAADPLSALSQLQSDPSALQGAEGLGDLAGLFGGGEAGGGMTAMILSMVYPDLKPMLEASIRKVTVTVKWREGSNDRTLELVQYLTSPQQGGLDPNAAEGLDALDPSNLLDRGGVGSDATKSSGEVKP